MPFLGKTPTKLLDANVNIDGGNIDGTTIGASSTAPATVSTFTSTGIDDNATSTAITIDASENVGVGTTTPVSLGAGYSNIDIRNTTGGGVTLGDTSNIHAYLFSDNNGVTLQSPGSRSIKFTTVSTERMRIDSSGDVLLGTTTTRSSFLTATTGNLNIAGGVIVDAGSGVNAEFLNYRSSATVFGNGGAEQVRIDSSGNVGIGTSSPSNTLTVNKDTGSTPTVYINNSGAQATEGAALKVQASGRGAGIGDTSVFSVHNNASEIFTVRNDGNVGIGTASPNTKLDVIGSTTNGSGVVDTLRLRNTGTTLNDGPRLQFTAGTSTSGAAIAAQGKALNSADLLFYAGGNTERMRIDASGNLLVGTTSNAPTTTAGINLGSNNKIHATRSGGASGYFNRLTSDGGIVEFAKDGTTVGSIGSSNSGSCIYIAAPNENIGIKIVSDDVRPTTGDGTDSDNVMDLGNSTARWDDVYATNGTIQTSDANEKQNIEALSEAETRVAVAAKALLRKFRWKSSVEEKGDDARIHFGIIAQDLQAAFEAEGLDAGRYGMFIHSTWTDEETGEERSRMGVRYSELLAFIIAAI